MRTCPSRETAQNGMKRTCCRGKGMDCVVLWKGGPTETRRILGEFNMQGAGLQLKPKIGLKPKGVDWFVTAAGHHPTSLIHSVTK